MAFGTDYTPVGPMPTDIVLGDVDATSMRLARDIRDKGHGIDTRETMARMILKSSTLHNHLIKVNNALKVQNDEYYRQYSDVIAELSKDKDYHSLPEIAGARGGKATLGERLDKEHNEVTAQLAQKTTKGDIGLSDFDKSKTLFNATWFTDEFLEDLNGGTINATSVLDRSLTNSKYALGSVDEDILKKGTIKNRLFLDSVEPINLFNKDSDDFIPGKYVTPSSTTGFGDSDFYWASPKISAVEGDFFKLSEVPWGAAIENNRLAFFDSSDKPVGVANSISFSIPPNTAYFRFTIRVPIFADNGGLDRLMVVKGENTPSTYIPYGVKMDWIRNDSYKVLDRSLTNSKYALGSVDEDILKKGTIKNRLFLDSDEPINLFNKDSDDFIPGKYVASTLPTGFGDSDYYLASPKISAVEGDFFSLSEVPWETAADNTRLAFFDSSDKPIAETDSISFSIPPNTAYFRFTINVPSFVNNGGLDRLMVVKGENTPSTYIPYGVKIDWIRSSYSGNTSKLNGKKWLSIGDSITVPSYSFNHKIAERTGVALVNHGLNGRAWARRGGTTDETYKPVVDNWDITVSDVDIITVSCGTNDFASRVPLGDLDSDDPTTLLGAMDIVSRGLIEKYPGKLIAYLTPLHRRTPDLSVEGNKTMLEWSEAMVKKGAQYGIPVFNATAKGGLYPKSDIINETLFSNADGLHPNEQGSEVYAPRVQGFLESLI